MELGLAPLWHLILELDSRALLGRRSVVSGYPAGVPLQVLEAVDQAGLQPIGAVPNRGTRYARRTEAATTNCDGSHGHRNCHRSCNIHFSCLPLARAHFRGEQVHL